MSASTRIRQGLRALMAFAQPVDYDLAAHYLTPQQLALFQQLTRDEQLHSVRVLQSLLSQPEQTPHDLAVAALLHDVGKIRYAMSVWQRSLAVVLRKLSPHSAARWAASNCLHDWRAPFVVVAQHPQWGAELVAETNAPERVVWLIAHHADDSAQWLHHAYYPLLRRLQRADDLN